VARQRLGAPGRFNSLLQQKLSRHRQRSLPPNAETAPACATARKINPARFLGKVPTAVRPEKGNTR
jgi:hypothetical protein